MSATIPDPQAKDCQNPGTCQQQEPAKSWVPRDFGMGNLGCALRCGNFICLRTGDRSLLSRSRILLLELPGENYPRARHRLNQSNEPVSSGRYRLYEL